MSRVSLHFFDVDRGVVLSGLNRIANAECKKIDIKISSVFELLAVDKLLDTIEDDLINSDNYYVVYGEKAISVFGEKFTSENIYKIVDEYFYTRAMKYVLIINYNDKDKISLVLHKSGKNLAELRISKTQYSTKTYIDFSNNLKLLENAMGFLFDMDSLSNNVSYDTDSLLKEIALKTNIPIDLSFSLISKAPLKYDANYECFSSLCEPRDNETNSLHILNCKEKEVGDYISRICNMRNVAYSEDVGIVSPGFVLGYGVHNNNNYSFYTLSNEIKQNNFISEISNFFSENYMLLVYENRKIYNLTLLKNSKIISKLTFEKNKEWLYGVKYSNFECFEEILGLDLKYVQKVYDQRDLKYTIDSLAKKICIPINFVDLDILDFFRQCKPDQFIIDTEEDDFFSEEIEFDEKAYSKATLNMVADFFGN